jgi:EpsI family protein
MTGRRIHALVALVILVAFGSFGFYLRSYQTEPDRGPDFSVIPMETDQYLAREHRFDEFAYEVLQADTSTLRMYQNTEGDMFWLFIAYFSSQKYGAQIHSPKHCLPGGGYRIMSNEPYPITLDDGNTITVNRLAIADQRRMELMFYWYETRSGVVTDEFGLKLDLMKNSVMLNPTDAAICRLTMPLSINADFERETERAIGFIRDMYPAMISGLPFHDD